MIFKRIIKFLLVGGMATVIQYLLLILLVAQFSVLPLYASIASYLVSAVFNYYANYYFTFECNENHYLTLLKFTLIASVGLLLNSVVFYSINSLLGLHYIVAQLIATVFVLIWNFTANHFWTFKNRGL